MFDSLSPQATSMGPVQPECLPVIKLFGALICPHPELPLDGHPLRVAGPALPRHGYPDFNHDPAAGAGMTLKIDPSFYLVASNRLSQLLATRYLFVRFSCD